MKIEHCKTAEERTVILDGINAYNDSKTSRILEEVHQPIELLAKNDKNEIVGGVIGYVGYYAGFKINILWMREDTRGSGLGSQLLKQAEKEAKLLGANIVLLDTFSFQAEDFYIKNGYKVFGRIEDYPKKHQELIFLRKNL